jgi:hypothetical protein
LLFTSKSLSSIITCLQYMTLRPHIQVRNAFIHRKRLQIRCHGNTIKFACFSSSSMVAVSTFLVAHESNRSGTPNPLDTKGLTVVTRYLTMPRFQLRAEANREQPMFCSAFVPTLYHALDKLEFIGQSITVIILSISSCANAGIVESGAEIVEYRDLRPFVL